MKLALKPKAEKPAKAPKPPKPAREKRAKREKPPREKEPFRLFRRKERRAVERPPVVMPQYAKPGSHRLGLILAILLGVFCFAYGFGFGVFAPARMVQFFFPILIVGGLAVWALPELGKAPADSVERLFFIFFVCLPLWPNYLAVDLPGLPWITVARILGFPLVLLLLFSISVSPTFRAEMGRPLSGVPLLWKAIAAFSVLQVLSVGLSSQPQFSLNKLLVAQVNQTAIFFIAAYVFTRPGRIERWGMLWWFMGVIVALMCAAEFRQRAVLWAGHIPSFLAVDDPTVQLVGRARAGTDIYRVLGTFATSLGVSEFLALTTPFALHFMLGPYRLALRVATALSLPIILYAIILTDSRLGMVGFLLSIMLYVFFWGALRWRQNRRSIVGPIVVLSYPAFAAAFMVAVFTVQRLRVMTLGGGKHQASTDARFDQIALGMPKLFSHPFGYGIGRGPESLGFVNLGGGLTIDSYYLLVALDYGFIGFFLFFGIFVIGMVQGFRTIVSGTKTREQTMLVPLVIAVFCYFVIKSIYAGIENQSAIFMMLGAITALVYRVRMSRGEPAEVERRRQRRRLIGHTAIA